MALDINKIYNELLGRDAKQEGKDYWSERYNSGNMSIRQIENAIKAGKEYNETYRGPVKTAYTSTVPAYTGSYDKGSKGQRTAENEWQQRSLDEIIGHVQTSGVGNLTISDTSKPKWMPISDHDRSYDLNQYRDQDSRVAEDIWQQGQIGDLETWALDVADEYGLSFTPSEVYHGIDTKRGDTTYSTHPDEGAKRNLSQSKGIGNITDFLSKLDEVRAPTFSATKDSLSNIYGEEIDNIYNELFGTEGGIDQAGKDYWTKDLLENRPNLAEGQDWKDWLERAFKNTNSYKDHIAEIGPIDLPMKGIGEDGQFTDVPEIEGDNFNTELDKEKEEWDIDFGNPLNTTFDFYTSQINDLMGMLDDSDKRNEERLKAYKDEIASSRKADEARAAYGERPMNQSVKGVRTLNELPGYKPKTGGSTGHFNRTGNRLSTSSLNI